MSRINRSDLDTWFDNNLSIATRTIIIADDIDAASVSMFLKGFHILEQKKDETINIILSSFGGDWYSGLAVFDAVRSSPCNIIVKGTGPVMSMGSIIMLAGDERVLTPNARLMLHYGSIGSEEIHSKIFDRWAKDEKKNLTIMEDMYLEVIRKKHPKFSRKKIQEMLNFDTILNAEEAVELGLADRVE